MCVYLLFIKRFFEDSKEFLIKKDGDGAENILYVTVHMDEETPHMHLKTIKLHYTPFLSF
ncbi:plasmid recombination protein [Staphylococcus epidermidis]|nr:plasmid recombination protein [Staphylococcus epidermidis]MBM0768394.1 hypothetical protein [Staphylococcus epidermidis]MBO0389643.1 plasmid recombination protein [Staphylococcus epidermidis]MCG1646238.1 plasmid recombination protein [Staphylococcus epidermidis]MCG1648507.1 plasmid recombination protein [Staphylococcus epidermidis]